MFRRTSTARISEYSFGQPDLSRHFGRLSQRASEGNKDAGIKSTTMPNGLRVVTHDKGQAVTSVGFYIEAGAKYDPSTICPGLNYALRYTLLSSNMESSNFQNDRTLRGYGAHWSDCEIRKRYIGVKADVRRDAIAPVVNVYSACIAAPRFANHDTEKWRDHWDNQLEEHKFKEMHDHVVDGLEETAFFKEPLGNPRMMPVVANEKANAKTLIDQWASHFIPNRMVLAGVNVDHEALCAAYLGGSYPHSAEAPHHARSEKPAISHTDEKLQFYPGRQADAPENLAAKTHEANQKQDCAVALGWITNGRDGNLKDYAVTSIIQEIMGMNFDDSLTPASRTTWADGTRTFYRPYSTAGLIGYSVKQTPNKIVDAVIKTTKLPAAVDASQLEAAKARALNRMFAAELDSQSDYLDFIATSNFGVNDFNVALKNVTVADANKELEAMKSKPPAMFSLGHTEELPNLQTILAAQK